MHVRRHPFVSTRKKKKPLCPRKIGGGEKLRKKKKKIGREIEKEKRELRRFQISKPKENWVKEVMLAFCFTRPVLRIYACHNAYKSPKTFLKGFETKKSTGIFFIS